MSSIQFYPATSDVKSLLLGRLAGYSVTPAPPKSRWRQMLAAPNAKSARALQELQDDVIGPLLAALSAEDFKRLREKAFPQYFSYGMALRTLVMQHSQPSSLATINAHSLKAIERMYESRGSEVLGRAVAEDAIFLISTARRTLRIASLIAGTAPLSPADVDRDGELAQRFVVAMSFSEMHGRLLSAFALGRCKAPPTDVVAEIMDGFRAVVNAYGVVREAHRMRQPVALDEQPGELDDEERWLTTASGNDPWLAES